jgi:hypothetical protein
MPGEPSSKNVLEGHQEGDAFAPHKKSASEELAEFQLLKEKMMIRTNKGGLLDESVVQILGAMSEVELLTLKIAQQLSTGAEYSQSTAQYQELVRFTGENSYIGIAKKLASEIYAIKRGQYLFSKFDKGVDIDGLARARRNEGGTALGDFLKPIVSLLGPSGGASSSASSGT